MNFDPIHKRGDVFQINEHHGRGGWIGAFVMAEEVKPWGIQGYVFCLDTHETHQRAYVRLEWADVDYIGPAALVPVDHADE